MTPLICVDLNLTPDLNEALVAHSAISTKMPKMASLNSWENVNQMIDCG